jgi:hypothetical protein
LVNRAPELNHVRSEGAFALALGRGGDPAADEGADVVGGEDARGNRLPVVEATLQDGKENVVICRNGINKYRVIQNSQHTFFLQNLECIL